jgi:hypothetical protein
MSEGYDGYALQARVAELERKVEYLMQRLAGPPVTTPIDLVHPNVVSPGIIDLVRQGHKIEAIKQYRQETGASLRDAKDVIDRIG